MPKARVNVAGLDTLPAGETAWAGTRGMVVSMGSSLPHSALSNTHVHLPHGNTLALASRQPKRSIDLWHQSQDPQHVQL